MNTINAISAHPEAKVVWLGLGSAVYLGDENIVLRTPQDQEMLRNTFQGHTVIVRDSLANTILNEAGVENHFLPCPSYFFKPVCQTSRELDVIFYHAVKTGISAGYWNEENIENYRYIFRKFYNDNAHENLIIAVCEPDEIPIAKSLFWQKPILLKDPIDTFHICKNARKVLSSRIHNAVPALVYGAEVGIVPVDSRHHTITDWFDIKVSNVTDLHKIKKYDITTIVSGNIDVYRKLIFTRK